MITNEPQQPPRRNWLRWFFEDAGTGRIVIAQFPNWPLWIFIVAWAAQTIFHPTGVPGTILTIAKLGGLTIWALDEIVRGVCPWRRVLGGGVLAFEIITLLRSMSA